MKRIFLLAITAILFSHIAFAGGGKDSTAQELMKMIAFRDSVEKAMKYTTGKVILPQGFAALNIPPGFKYLNAEQSKFVIKDAWGNPARPDVLGMVFPADASPFSDSSYAYVISFDEVGYVKDDDAAELNYTEMMQQFHDEEVEENKQRAADGYEPVHIIGWAQTPFYDKNRKVLHWAKEIKFGEGGDENTLNYDIRVLGRKGVLSFNAVAGMSGMPMVKQDIDKVLAMAEFTAGNKYSDFDDKTDNIAAYTIGGLVAGKILMKVGFWALIVKFWKLIIGGVIAAFYGVKKFFTARQNRRRGLEDTYVEEASEPVV